MIENTWEQKLVLLLYQLDPHSCKETIRKVRGKKIGLATRLQILDKVVCILHSVNTCGLKSNGIDYSHRICVWPSGKEKRECEFVDSLYASSGNLHMRRRGYKNTKLARQWCVILRAESRHWVKRSWCELQSRVILKVGASIIVGMKEFWPPPHFFFITIPLGKNLTTTSMGKL